VTGGKGFSNTERVGYEEDIRRVDCSNAFGRVIVRGSYEAFSSFFSDLVSLRISVGS